MPVRNLLLAGVVAGLTFVAYRFAADAGLDSAGSRPLPAMATSDTVPRQAVPCGDIPEAGRRVLLVLGQSNAANHGQADAIKPALPAGVYSFHAGQCHAAVDPMPGATGTGASFMPRLGRLLIERQLARNVIFVPLGIESTRVADWAGHPVIRQRLRDTVALLQAHRLTVTQVLWQQGEADSMAGTPGKDYEEAFKAVYDNLRQLGIDAPIYVARASLCKGRISPAIQAAQDRLPGRLAGVRPGPDMDRLDAAALRFQACHFTAAGLDRVAALWADSLVARP